MKIWLDNDITGNVISFFKLMRVASLNKNFELETLRVILIATVMTKCASMKSISKI